MSVVSYSDVLEAYHLVKDVVCRTPVLTSQAVNSQSQAQVFFKCENFQRIGAFKFRGAYHAIKRLQLSDWQKPVF